MDDRELSDLLNDDPFSKVGPSDYENWLYGMLQLAFANLAGITHEMQQLRNRIQEHEHMHQAANVAAMSMPESTKEEKPN